MKVILFLYLCAGILTQWFCNDVLFFIEPFYLTDNYAVSAYSVYSSFCFAALASFGALLLHNSDRRDKLLSKLFIVLILFNLTSAMIQALTMFDEILVLVSGFVYDSFINYTLVNKLYEFIVLLAILRPKRINGYMDNINSVVSYISLSFILGCFCLSGFDRE
jgi:hypothetical protein